MLKGIDISHWQANLDIASTGAEFVICKATQGTTFVDPSRYQLDKGSLSYPAFSGKKNKLPPVYE